MSPFADLLLALYYGLLVLLAIFGAHRALLLVLYLRHRRPLAAPALQDDLPVVTVQLPLYNEVYVGPRLLDAVCRLDYPSERLEIQVLDDSTDSTREVLAARVEHWRKLGVDVHHLCRQRRTGFKAGALEAGLRTARGELVAVFDADFVPRRNFLLETVRWFRDPRIGMVQTRWDYLNRRLSLLTRVQAILLDGHFRIEHAARHRSGRFFNFNGTAGVWRRDAIEDAGGWCHDTLTEDLDLSYRAQLSGWRFVYLADHGAPSELPADIASFKTQQYRWAKGSAQTARKLLGPLLRSPIAWWQKLEGVLHLIGNVSYPIMVALSLLVFPAMLVRRGTAEGMLLAVDLPLFAAATLSVLAFYLTGQTAASERDASPLAIMPLVLSLGIGLSVNNARAVLSGLRSMGGVFERTPKYCQEDSSRARTAHYRAAGRAAQYRAAGRAAQYRAAGRAAQYRAAVDPSFVWEGLLALYFLLCALWTAAHGMWTALPFLCLFLNGYGYVFLLSAREALRQRQAGLETAAPTPV